MNAHRRIEDRSLHLHRAVAEKLRLDPRLLQMARRRVDDWCRDGSVHPRYAEAWRRLLSLGPEAVAQQLTDHSEEMRALRQCSPFAGALEPRERWRILREARDAERP